MTLDDPQLGLTNRRWQCHTCKEWHTGLPLDYAWDSPYYYWVLPEEDQKRSFLNNDLCVIEERDYFIRGVIEIPIIGTTECFRWGVWSSLSVKNFQFVVDHWDDRDLDRIEPMFGWLSTKMDPYPDTLNLKVNVCLRSNRLRPKVVLEPTEHPLAVDQRRGITLARVEDFAAGAIHD